jgi:hypothetical protein
VTAILSRHKPGDILTVSYVDRTGETVTGRVALQEDPALEIVPIESAGGQLTAAQRSFRERWLH